VKLVLVLPLKGWIAITCFKAESGKRKAGVNKQSAFRCRLSAFAWEFVLFLVRIFPFRTSLNRSMTPAETPRRAELLDEIERRQDDVLRKLEELDRQISGVLKQHTAKKCEMRNVNCEIVP